MKLKNFAFTGFILTAVLPILLIPVLLIAQQESIPNEQIDYPTFLEHAEKVHSIRRGRRVSEKQFLEMMKDESTIVLDTRSAWAYRMRHIKGAQHLSFSDFTKESLARVIPKKNTRVLIYCNNSLELDKEQSGESHHLRHPWRQRPFLVLLHCSKVLALRNRKASLHRHHSWFAF